MINELIEKEIEKFKDGMNPKIVEVRNDPTSNYSAVFWSKAGEMEDAVQLLKLSLQTIAKEVAMRFKYEFETTDGMIDFCDQIINEVSE